MAGSTASKTAGLVLGATLGKALGMVRDISLAYFFGASKVADAFRVSLLATLVLTHFFMEDVLSGAFVPLYKRYQSDSPASAVRLLRFTGAYLIAVSTLLVGVIWFGAGILLRLVAPGLENSTRALAAAMVRWMALGVPFYCVAALLSLYGICINRFRPIALRPAFQNAGLVLIIPLASLGNSPAWIGLGFSGAFVLYLGFVVWELGGSESYLRGPRPTGPLVGVEARALYRTALPLVYMMALGQMLAIVDRAAASFVGVGAIASLEYARVFVETPHVLVGAAIATTALSRFSGRDEKEVSQRAPGLILGLLTFSLGLMAILALAAPELVSIVYQHGKFDAAGVVSVTRALRGLAFGGAFMTTSYLMNRVLSAQMRNRESVAPMLVCVIVAVVANLLLAPRLGVLGVGLSMTIAYLTMCALLARRLDLWDAIRRRLLAWILAGTMTCAVAFLVRQLNVPATVRLGLIGIGSALAWLGGVAVFATGRADIAVLLDQGSRLLERWRSRETALTPQS